ncbi:MAG: sigma-54 dependent transcriptional regulator [Planctomycetota bacterium]
MKSEAAVGSRPRILILDTDGDRRAGLEAALLTQGAWVESTTEVEDAARRHDSRPFDLIFVGGRAAAAAARLDGDTASVVRIVGEEGVGEGDAALEVLCWPGDGDRVSLIARRCLELRGLRARAARAEARLEEVEPSTLLGQGEGVRRLEARIAQVAQTPDTAVLIHGEHGTGRELVARRIHASSARAAGPFLTVNCAALTEGMLEAELFGYEAGAFAGAMRDGKDGLFAAAEGGTLYLDEISAMPTSLQAKILRVLQERAYRRVGGVKDNPARVRILASASRDLATAVQRGDFRQDLYYRLHVITIHVPPLREREDDIPLLAHYFLDRFARRMGKALGGFTEEAMETLSEYSWPGNVRELRNAIEYAALKCGSGMVEEQHLPRWDGTAGHGTDLIPRDTVLPLPEGDRSLRSMEKALIGRVLDETGWNISRAAQKLGINRTTLYNKIKLYKLGTRPARDRLPV